MAEAILFSVAQKMIENLSSQTFREIGLLWGVADDLEKIHKTVSTIAAVLMDAVEQKSNNPQGRAWLEELKDAVYEADDLLSEFSTKVSRQRATSGYKITKEVRTFFAKLNQIAFHREMSVKIKAMRKKLDAIAEAIAKFHLKVFHVEPNVVTRYRGPTHSLVSKENVIGREDDIKAIIGLLMDSDVEENVSVIPIVGESGIGKTTLAQHVYNHEMVKKHFDLKVWVCAPEPFDLEIIVKNILASATGETPQELDFDQTQARLREMINDKKYLLVLDDVRNEDVEKWRNLKYLLMGGYRGSKIIITTRSGWVAAITRTVSPYPVAGLSKEQSWSLFEKVVFSNRQVNNKAELVTIGRQIVRGCRGVPLAIKLIGSSFYGKETESEWRIIEYQLLENQRNDIFSILKLSYDHLPLHLKSCFTYCSFFPNNYEMDKETMIQLWIAQGFIQSSDKDQQLEDVGDGYFKDLLWRSFFEEVESFGMLRYKMHDSIHDLAQSIARDEFQLINSQDQHIYWTTRHLLCKSPIDSSFIENSSLLGKGDKIRTFLQPFGGHAYFRSVLDESMLKTLILRFKSLRALDLHELDIKRVPNSIGELLHLKYLNLANCMIITLPHSITRLWNLHTLILRECKHLKELPQDIKELVNLRHLDNSYCYELSHMPSGLGKMTCLQTLALFVVSNDNPSISKNVSGLGELNGLNYLRGTLEITNLERLEDANSESKAAKLWDKKYLEKLKLKWDRWVQIDNASYGDEKTLEGFQPHQNLKSLEVNGYGGVRFSNWLSLLTNLVDLKLSHCKRCRHLPQSSQLPYLKRIDLSWMDDLEYISEMDISEDVSASFFPSLNSLHIDCCPNLKGWWSSTSTPDHQRHQSLPSFPLLSSLRIHRCPNLTSMPLFPNLEESLYLGIASLKPLQQTMEMIAKASSLPSSSSSSSPLSKLKSMCLYDIVDDGASLPDEWASDLHSLKSLQIAKYPRLTSMLPRAMEYLTSLEELGIQDCDQFNPLSDMDTDVMEWRHLNCLSSVRFQNLQKLESLPAGLQHVTNLKKLFISDCTNLISLPGWMSNLTSLEHLTIERCPQLHKGLEIGKERLKIAHVPNVTLLASASGSSSMTATTSLDAIKSSLRMTEGAAESPLLKTQEALESSLLKTQDAAESSLRTTQHAAESPLLRTQGALESSLLMTQDVAEYSLPTTQRARKSPLLRTHSAPGSSLLKIQDVQVSSLPMIQLATESPLPGTYSVPGPSLLKTQDATESLSTTQGATDSLLLMIQGAAESPLLRTEDALESSLLKTQDAAESSLSWTQGSMEPSLPRTPGATKSVEVYVGNNTWSYQDELQDDSFKSMKVSGVSELMEVTGLHGLKIEGCDALEFIPKEVMNRNPFLQHLYIINCCSLQSFPKGHPPTALKILYIQNCKKLEFCPPAKKRHQFALERLCIGSSCDSMISLLLGFFPKLKSLSIWDCANLESLSMPEGIRKDLKSLEALEIRDCPKLVSFQGGLPTPNLTSIWFSNCKNLKQLPGRLHTLNSLQSMFINNCPELVSLPEGGLPSNLGLLSITFCDKLMLKGEWRLHELDSLRQLEIEGGCKNVVSIPDLPRNLNSLPSNLNSLRISGLSNLEFLNLQNLTVLKTLEISCCNKLQSLPEEDLPSSLSFLCIKECSLLKPKHQNRRKRLF